MSGDRPGDWASRRKKVYRRDNYTCQNCGAKGGDYGDAELHAHHIVPRKDGGSDKVSNLKTLCKGCHNAIHHKHKKAPTHSPKTSKTNKIRLTKQEKAEAFLYYIAFVVFFSILVVFLFRF